MNDLIKEKLKLLPDLPGVYKMYDAGGNVIYVGKAINLKNRVRQYFRSADTLLPKVAAMVSHVVNFEYILTSNETEALSLESNLIKELRPRYNILLKDDKHFPYVRLNIKQDYPRFEVVRKIKNDGARYFGPYLSSVALRDSLTAIRELFPVRHCKKDIKKAIDRRERPCLMYHIGKCCAPCSGKVSREEYHELLTSVCSFLEGNTESVTELLSKKMYEASEKMEFERAALLRDRINAIKRLGERQQVISASETERDVLALVRKNSESIIFALFMRGGKVIGTEHYEIECSDDESNETVMASFMKQHYVDAGVVPREIVVSDMPEDNEAIALWLSENAGHKIVLTCPQRGEKAKQIKMAYENGAEELDKMSELARREWERSEGAAARLSLLIGMETVPYRIECFDNSHIMGRDTVASMVVFEGGKPAKKQYRRFKIKTDVNGDDYAAMKEALTRRFERAKNGDEKFSVLPDLLVVDGGRGQLNVALEVLREFGISDMPTIGLAEKNEEIILPYSHEPLVLEKRDGALHLLQRLRDEAHRFAITYHRSMHAKTTLYSVLSEIEGIGEKRRRALFDAFITLDAIKAASIEELAAVKGMNITVAKAVHEHFN
ncbi:MAG: excinuclease ABC subunit UvrC [Clostridia bacterium]|nr:excinuclease ABC subunit UvrC [Clostridia bacterium]